MSDRTASRSVYIWLFVSTFMVFAMAVIGAITRLTESGLSMVEWRPLIGTIPPLNEEEWQRVFNLYRETPEYRYKNVGMELPEFKMIFFWEWFHRVWGRLIGVVYAVPFFYFLVRKKIDRKLAWKLAALLLLGVAQGFMGWYMVMSGLVDRPSVSHYRLAAHLLLAVALMLFLWRIALGLWRSDTKLILPFEASRIYKSGWFLFFVTMLTVIYGAFVAGLDAGLIYNTFPLMGGQIVPSDMWHEEPLWINFFENRATIQFTHRVLGLITLALIVLQWFHTRHHVMTGIIRKLSTGMMHMAILQVLLGVATLYTNVHVHVAATHQAGAMILLLLIIWYQFELSKAISR